MAILRSSDGRFYDVSDDHLEETMIPAEEIKERLGEAGVAPTSGPVGSGPEMVVPGTGGQVVIQVYTGGGPGGPQPVGPDEHQGVEGDVEAHGWCWRRNYFSNCWRRNCWRNSCW